MDIEPAYQNTLDYLYSFVDYSLTRGFRNQPGQFDLGRMRRFYGTTWATRTRPIRSCMSPAPKAKARFVPCAPVRCSRRLPGGLYTSPHLQDYAERIQIDGQPIPHADLVALVDEIRPSWIWAPS